MFTTSPDRRDSKVKSRAVGSSRGQAPTLQPLVCNSTGPRLLRLSAASGKNIQNWLCVLLVFVAGAASLAIEMAASRLLAPYFGSSLFVWANLIGLILLYLTIGYYVGGRLADHRPSPRTFYSITILAALLIGVIPLIAHPILTWTLNIFITGGDQPDPYGSFYASFVF